MVKLSEAQRVRQLNVEIFNVSEMLQGEDPRQALDREITWEWGGGYRARTDRGERLKDELIAIAALIEAHHDEFATIITTNQARRDWLEKKAALKRTTAAGDDRHG